MPWRKDSLPLQYSWASLVGSDGKESVCYAGDLGLIPGLGRSPGGGHGNPLQYSCLENPMNRGAWQATWGHKESNVTKHRTAHRGLLRNLALIYKYQILGLFALQEEAGKKVEVRTNFTV